MEGYKSFYEAVSSVKDTAKAWKHFTTGDVFTYDEMEEAAKQYDAVDSPGGWNYFVSFPGGEVGILSTEDNEVMPMFLPVKDETSASEEKAPEKAAKPRFCHSCGAQVKERSVFCPICGTTLKKRD